MTPKQMKKKRQEMGLSQADLAKLISEKVLKGISSPISDKTISQMELGNRKIQPYVVTFFKNNVDTVHNVE